MAHTYIKQLAFLAFILGSLQIFAQNKESQKSIIIPKGKVTKKTIYNILIYDIKLYREYYLYVPAQYTDTAEVALMIFQDGWIFADKEDAYVRENQYVPDVLDQLINEGKMPVTIAVFVNPGHIDENYPKNRMENSKRSEEYDELSDRYVSFLIDRLVPEISDKYRITTNPNLKAIAGFSSGGICAFTAAWYRPDYFGRVLSFNGAFVNIRGGHNYPYLIRSTPKKDIKVYLQSGEKDLDIVFGNFWWANHQMAAALKFKGYDYEFVKTSGSHGQFIGKHLKSALEWLWNDNNSQSE